MYTRFRRALPGDAHALGVPGSSSALTRAAMACALAIALEGCGQTLDKEHFANLACQPDAVRACLEVSAKTGSDTNQTAGKLSAEALAATRCAEFMNSSPPPRPNSSPAIRFWPNTAAGRYHENLLRKCGDLWAQIRMNRVDQMDLGLARASARQFFEHCLSSMSRRKLTDFETKLYCFDMYITLKPLVNGHPHEYWAYMVYRTAPEKSSEHSPVVASAFCEKFGTREACNDLKQLNFPTGTN